MINYKHLHYFWMVAKQGSITRASELLHLTPQTISGQITLLEDKLGQALFSKSGRNIELTETGRVAFSYADEIFSLGGELEQMLRNLPADRPMTFKVGVVDAIAKTIAYRILSPALDLENPLRIICKENSLDRLLAELAVHRIDLVIADGPIPSGLSVRGFNHLLGECGISFLASSKLANSLIEGFPNSLKNAPMLLPSAANQTQARLLEWLDSLHIYPRIVGEFDDSALMKAFGQAGTGVFTVPSAIAREVADQYNVQILGGTEEVREEFYAISAERRISHPAVAVITETARTWLK